MANEQKSQSPRQQLVEIKKAAENVYVVTGGLGANSGIIALEEGALVIDVKMSPEFGKIVFEEAKKLTKGNVERIILTHSDIDHVNGIVSFPKGLKITATEKTRQEMEADFKAKDAEEFLPNDLFTSEKDIDFHGLKLKLYHIDTAHTGGDSIVFVPDRRLAFVGDLLFVSRPAIIHRHKGGSSAGLINNLRFILTLDADLFISGHTDKMSPGPEGRPVASGQVPFADRKTVEAILTDMENTRLKVEKLVKKGISLKEVKNEMKVIDEPVQPGSPVFPNIVEIIYLELTEKHV